MFEKLFKWLIGFIIAILGSILLMLCANLIIHICINYGILVVGIGSLIFMLVIISPACYVIGNEFCEFIKKSIDKFFKK